MVSSTYFKSVFLFFWRKLVDQSAKIVIVTSDSLFRGLRAGVFCIRPILTHSLDVENICVAYVGESLTNTVSQIIFLPLTSVNYFCIKV